MNKGDGTRSLADGGDYALDVAAPYVAERNNARTTRFQQIGRPLQRLALDLTVEVILQLPGKLVLNLGESKHDAEALNQPGDSRH